MLALVMLLAGAGVSAVVAVGTVGGHESGLAVIATVIQLAVAGALWLNIVGARLAAIGVLLAQLLLLLFVALLFMAWVALPLQGGGPIVGHDFNPVWFAITLTAIVLTIALYLLAIRSAWRHSERTLVAA